MDNNLEIDQLIDNVNNIIEQINTEGKATKDQINELLCGQDKLISLLLKQVELANEVQKTSLKFMFKLMDTITKKGTKNDDGEVVATFSDSDIKNLNSIMSEVIEKGLMN